VVSEVWADYANRLKRRRAHQATNGTWDEVFLTIMANAITCGARWNQRRQRLDILVHRGGISKRRRSFSQAAQGLEVCPGESSSRISSRAYEAAAKREILPGVEHRPEPLSSITAVRNSERNQPYSQREIFRMQGFKSRDMPSAFCPRNGPYAQTLSPSAASGCSHRRTAPEMRNALRRVGRDQTVGAGRLSVGSAQHCTEKCLAVLVTISSQQLDKASRSGWSNPGNFRGAHPARGSCPVHIDSGFRSAYRAPERA